MKKAQLLISMLILSIGLVSGQKNYDFGPRNGKLDSASANPGINEINNNKQCIKYVRESNAKYDNIKIYPQGNLVDVSPYSSYTGIPPKITMKVYTSAPVGTKVELQLGKKDDHTYPGGVHSQYEAVTTVQNAWEVLTFIFAEIPKGSLVKATEVDQVTLLFSPNSTRSDTFYFDDLSFPALVTDTKTKTESPEKK